MTTNQKMDLIIRMLNATPEQQDALSKLLEADTAPVAVSASAPVSMDARIHDLLTELGTPCHLTGYRYLTSAIHAVIENPDVLNAITKVLYPQVSRAFRTTPSRVERSIRHAIEVTWDRGDLDVFHQYFGNSVSSAKGTPTNSEFVARCAEIITTRLGRDQ